jgi:hypothetical protein
MGILHLSESLNECFELHSPLEQEKERVMVIAIPFRQPRVAYARVFDV